jgi:hypothetical protein
MSTGKTILNEIPRPRAADQLIMESISPPGERILLINQLIRRRVELFLQDLQKTGAGIWRKYGQNFPICLEVSRDSF